jgi:hypothetical protein
MVLEWSDKDSDMLESFEGAILGVV